MYKLGVIEESVSEKKSTRKIKALFLFAKD